MYHRSLKADNRDKSSLIYTLKSIRDKTPPCITLLETEHIVDIDEPH